MDSGRHDMVWERTVVAVTSESITIDVPLTMSLDPKSMVVGIFYLFHGLGGLIMSE